MRPEDLPLHEDVRNLGAALGRVIQRIEGDEAFYPDIDLRTVAGQGYAHRDGTPYPKAKRRN